MKPAAVRRQAEAADKLVKDLQGGKVLPPGALVQPSDGTAPPDLPNVGAPSGNDPNSPSGTEQGGAPAAPAAAPATPSDGTPPAAPAPSGDPATSVDWKHKFEVLQGKYDAEVPRLLEGLRETRSLVDQLSQQNQDLLLQSRQGASAPAQNPDASFRSLVTEKERNDFGEDLVDLIGRRAQEVVLPEVQRLVREQLDPLRQQVGRTAATAAQSAQQGVYEALNQQVPNWGEVNESVQFLAWLEQPDVFSGTSRRVALASAFEKHDASRVVGIFKAFLKEDTSFAPTPERQPAVDPETLVAPGTPRGGSAQEVAPGVVRGKIWQESEIRNFYDRVRRKKVTPEEYKQTSADLALATREGRIRPDRVDIHTNQ